jgi:hypothetical protein
MNIFKTIRVNYVVNYCQFLTKIRCATLATKIWRLRRSLEDACNASYSLKFKGEDLF